MTTHIYGRIYDIFICHIYVCSVWEATVARTLIQAMACKMKKSMNSQKVSIVLPSMRPSAPPISHIKASDVYASLVSICVCISSGKNICSTVVNTSNLYSRLALYYNCCFTILSIYQRIYRKFVHYSVRKTETQNRN